MLAAATLGAPMYYEIDGTNTRVLGSLHMFPGTPAALPPWVEGAYAWAEDLVVESEPNPATFLPYAQLPEGDALSNHLSPLIFGCVCTLWDGVLPPADLERMKPWLPWITMIERLMPLSPGVEPQLLPRAKSDGKAITELELAGEVPTMLDSVPDHAIEAALAFGFADPVRACNTLTALSAAWVRRDAAGVLRNAEAQPSYHGALGDVLIRQRNANWVPRLAPHIKSSRRTLLIVGAIHLLGLRNLMDGLSAEYGVAYRALP